jgi:hypothetical protein
MTSSSRLALSEATAFQVQNIRIAYVFYESGLSINVMYTIDDPNRRAVGFKLSEGMEVPVELASRYKFASQKSKLAGTIRGSYFAIREADQFVAGAWVRRALGRIKTSGTFSAEVFASVGHRTLQCLS